MEVKYYKSKFSLLPGTSYDEVIKHAQDEFQIIKRHTKRQPYIRSVYFRKDKIFFNVFWKHLFEKSFKVRVHRLKLFNAAVDLIKNSRFNPITKENPDNREELLHRFYGITKSKESFVVQIKENKRTKTKYLISIFPE